MVVSIFWTYLMIQLPPIMGEWLLENVKGFVIQEPVALVLSFVFLLVVSRFIFWKELKEGGTIWKAIGLYISTVFLCVRIF